MSEITSGPRSQAAAGPRPEAIKAIPVRHPWRWVSAVVITLLAADLVYMVVQSVSIDTTPDGPGLVAIWHYMFSRLILKGVLVTIELTVVAMVIGVILGVALAVMRLSLNPVVSSISWVYIWFFRGTPVLVQIFFWFNLNTVLQQVGVGIPFTTIGLSVSTNTLITPFLAVLFGLGFNEAAYMAEIVRAGIISVDQGQSEAAQALGMRRMQVMRRIVLPQAMRVIIPPTGNETISMLKTSSLAFVAGSAVAELFTVGDQIKNFNARVIELLFVVSIWYLVLTSILTFGQYYLERHFARGAQRELPPTPLQRFRRMLFTFHAPVPGRTAPPDVMPGARGGAM